MDNYKLKSFGSEEFSAKLVPLHTQDDKLHQKYKNAGNNCDKLNPFDEKELKKTSDYNDLSKSPTSFNRWLSQSALLDDLARDNSSPNKDSFHFLKDKLTNLDEDSSVFDDLYDEYALFFDKSKGKEHNNPVLTYVLSNSGEENKKADDKMLSEFTNFKQKYFELLDKSANKSRLKRALLTVLFNHYGSSRIFKYMTYDEYVSMVKTHKVFQDESTSKFMFQTMDRKNNLMITLNEFVSGMLSCSPECENNLNSASGKLRLQHVFRAYDSDRRGYLDKNSLELMFEHLSQGSGNAYSSDEKTAFSEKLLNMFNGKLSYDSFYYCVENGLMKHTNLLFRSKHDMASSFKDFISNALLNFTKNNAFDSPNLSSNSVFDTERSVRKSSPEKFSHRTTQLKNLSEMSNTYYSYNTQNLTFSSSTKTSLWSHTPRAYSEFTHNKSPSKDYGSSFDSNIYTSAFSPPKSTTSRLEELSKLYGDKPYGEENAENFANKTPTNELSPLKLDKFESEDIFEPQNVKPNEDTFVKSPPKQELLDDALTFKLPETSDKNDKLDQLLDKFNHPEKTDLEEMEPNRLLNLEGVESFDDVLEDDVQLQEQYKEMSDFFVSLESVEDLIEDKACELNENFKADDTFNYKFDDVDHKLDFENSNKFDDKEKPFELMKLMTFGEQSNTNEDKNTCNVLQSEPTSDLSPDSKTPLMDLTLQTLTNLLSNKYKSKFLVFKGLLVDDSAAKLVLKNFMSHTFGESTDHSTFKWCTYTDIVNLCDSVCYILKKENPVLNLNGEFQVYSSLNGDLSCLLDLFNAFGWPMTNKKSVDELVKNGTLNFKNNTWFQFKSSYIFFGGFVSELSSFCLEFVLLLFSLKVLFPFHVYFLRSPKDERDYTNNVGFYDEIYRKLSTNYESLKLPNEETLLLQCSKELFHRINDVFEYMSLCAVLNQEILCVDKLTNKFSLSKLEELNKPLNQRNFNKEVYELLFDNNSSEKTKNKDCLVQDTGGYDSMDENDFDLGESKNFNIVICSSDSLDSGFKYTFNNKVLLLSTNFIRKNQERVATHLSIDKKKLTLKSLKL
ncbi:calcium-dependent protein phosphatase, putative [Theileria annulata]|uniref:Calcium-dependent protein phosphatase, putative n=1 Tax=Theileria annulata TaxID=5874 RepID=Q4UE85_THEAN|nr:calcium-dependent protein phosphatase, putative [Theileria annulata]CAI74604.1 calcium-dependent protein phosphatase, putative [Theileria annulata]|eukprot:XP_952336.1 calcium-dependent protein phosphatase, putative [Theileria annulata]